MYPKSGVEDVSIPMVYQGMFCEGRSDTTPQECVFSYGGHD